MPRLYLIIDGYNLMHAAGFVRISYGSGDLERCRQRLLNQLIARMDQRIAKETTVVFDSLQTTVREEQSFPSPMTIRFSRDGRDADTEIEMLLSSHSSPKQVLVISSDHRLHKSASRRRAKCMDSEEFWALLESADNPWTPKKKNNSRKLPQSPGKASKGVEGIDMEADYAQEFLQIDVNEIKRSLRKEK